MPVSASLNDTGRTFARDIFLPHDKALTSGLPGLAHGDEGLAKLLDAALVARKERPVGFVFLSGDERLHQAVDLEGFDVA